MNELITKSFIKSLILDSTESSTNTIGDAIWLMDRLKEDNFRVCLYSTREEIVIPSSSYRTFYKRGNKVIRKRANNHSYRLTLYNENDFVLVETGWSSAILFIYYNDREVPPL